MLRFIIAALLTGIFFATMDGLINGNPYAEELMESYKPIVRESIDVPAALLIDLFYGLMMSGIYLLIMPVLPTESGLIKGIIYGSGIWFFRVVMSVMSSWVMFTIPDKTLTYILVTGFIEMIILGILNALIIKKKNGPMHYTEYK